MKIQSILPVFSWAVAGKYNFGIWKWPMFFIIPNANYYNFSSCAKYSVSWIGYTIEISWKKRGGMVGGEERPRCVTDASFSDDGRAPETPDRNVC